MNGEIVTEHNCKVGDKIIYSEKYLRDNRYYKEIVQEYNIVYLKIKSKNNSDIHVNLIDYKGIIHNTFYHRIIEGISKFCFYE